MPSVNIIEAEIAATRARLNETIDRIGEKLTLTGMVDEVMGQAGVPRFESGPDFLMGILKRHPVPVMIAAAGLGFLIYRQNRATAALSRRAIEDADFVEVPAVVNTGHARVYDPDQPVLHPVANALEPNRTLETQV